MKKIIALLATAALSLQMFAGMIVPTAAATTTTGTVIPVKVDNPPLSADAVEGNLLANGSIGSEDVVSSEWSSHGGATYSWVSDGNGGGYIESGKFRNEVQGMKYSPVTADGSVIPAGNYKITFYVRTAYENHLSKMCFLAYDVSGNCEKYSNGSIVFRNVYYSNEWTKAEFYFTLNDSLSYFLFRPTTSPILLTPFCVDEISLEKVDSIPSGSPVTVGTTYSTYDMEYSQRNLDLSDIDADVERWDLEESEKYVVDGLMLNLDNMFHGIDAVTCEQDVVDWANQFRGTHITDIIMNIAESKRVYPTEFERERYDAYMAAKAEAEAAGNTFVYETGSDLTDERVFFGWYGEPNIDSYENGKFGYDESTLTNKYTKHFFVNNLDYLKTLSTALPEAGINMWLSIRMNDAHDRGDAYSSLFSEYYFEHPEFRRAQYDTMFDTYYAKIWDYSFPEIRQKYLALLNDSLDRYDVYGYQYEFQREIRLFHPGGEYAGVETMNQFMRETAEIIDTYEEKYGHKIKFSVQVASDLQTNYDFGLDVMAWVGEGLVDMVSPKGRHSTTHNEMPLAMWKTMLEPFDVELAPDIEHRVNGNSTVPTQNEQKVDLTLNNIETYAGTAALYYSQGADKIQLYNLLVPMGHIFKEIDKISDFDPEIVIPEASGGLTSVSAWWLVFAHIGSYERLMTMDRTVLLTYNEIYAPWKGPDYRLPATLTVGATSVFRIGMGDVPEGATVTLRFAAANADPSTAPTVFVNSTACDFAGILESPSTLRTENCMYTYTIPKTVHGDMYAVAEITSASGMTIDYMDIHIAPAN